MKRIKKIFSFLPALLLMFLSGLTAFLCSKENISSVSAATEYLVTSYRQQSQLNYVSYNGTNISGFIDGTLNVLQDTTSGKYFYRYIYSFTINDGSNNLEKFYTTYNGNNRSLIASHTSSTYFSSLPTDSTFRVYLKSLNCCWDDDGYSTNWWKGINSFVVSDGVNNVTLDSTYYSYLYPYYNHTMGDIPEDTLETDGNINVAILQYDYSYQVDDYQNGYNAGYNVGYNDGYNAGINGGYENGYEDGYSAGVASSQTAYDNGYAAGIAEAGNQSAVANSIFDGIIRIGILPVQFFLSVFNFQVFGINVSVIITSFLAVAVTVILIRFITGKKF